MFFTGVSLSNARQTSQAVDVYVDTAKILNYRTRLLFFIGSASYAVLGLAPFGISRNSPLFLNCVVATQAVPSGISKLHYMLQLLFFFVAGAQVVSFSLRELTHNVYFWLHSVTQHS